jgi:hypothetical protein
LHVFKLLGGILRVLQLTHLRDLCALLSCDRHLIEVSFSLIIESVVVISVSSLYNDLGSSALYALIIIFNVEFWRRS